MKIFIFYLLLLISNYSILFCQESKSTLKLDEQKKIGSPYWKKIINSLEYEDNNWNVVFENENIKSFLMESNIEDDTIKMNIDKGIKTEYQQNTLQLRVKILNLHAKNFSPFEIADSLKLTYAEIQEFLNYKEPIYLHFPIILIKKYFFVKHVNKNDIYFKGGITAWILFKFCSPYENITSTTIYKIVPCGFFKCFHKNDNEYAFADMNSFYYNIEGPLFNSYLNYFINN